MCSIAHRPQHHWILALAGWFVACTPDDAPPGSESEGQTETSTPTTGPEATGPGDGETTEQPADDETGETGPDDDETGETGETGETTGEPTSSPGCGSAPVHTPGGVNVEIDAGPEGDGMRRFFLSLPANYDPQTPHKLIFGYPGTNWVGEQIAPYLQLESGAVAPMDDEIFVYPDPLWRDFEGWGNLGGWLLGPYATPADGEQDLVFTEAVIEYMEDNYCIDSSRIFATGHSWGGDMAQVVSCFMGDRFAATVPVAANRPYWFENGGGFIDCEGDTAVWTMFGQNDTHFGSQSQGLECRDFWLEERQCSGLADVVELGLGDEPGECVEYQGCSATTRFCLYGAQYGHQIPDAYFAAATMEFFRSL